MSGAEMRWFVDGGRLRALHPGEPAPPGGTPIDVPDAFLTDPRSYLLHEGRLVPRDELPAPDPPEEPLVLTRDEIARVKKAIKEGRI
jgi:hypothetical protein